jgi:hypothetical protein
MKKGKNDARDTWIFAIKLNLISTVTADRCRPGKRDQGNGIYNVTYRIKCEFLC